MEEFFISKAIEIAKESKDDMPIGCVIADKNGNIIASAHNEKEKLNDPTAHAEMLAIKHACEKLKSWRLNNCSLYVTLEPCPMCACAIINARIENVYFGAYDNLYGAFGSKLDMGKIMNSKIKIYGGIKENECENLIKKYFEKLR